MKKQQKWIALLVILTFVGVLQVSTMPLVAIDNAGQADSAFTGQGTGFVEAVGHNASPASKKKILPVVLIGVGVVAVAAVLYFFVLKTNYDITGEWTMNYYVPNTSHSVTFSLTCIGDKKLGLIVSGTNPGDYIVDGKKVTINFRQTREEIPHRWEFIGEFTSTKRIGGDFKCYINEIHKPEYDAKFSLNKK